MHLETYFLLSCMVAMMNDPDSIFVMCLFFPSVFFFNCLFKFHVQLCVSTTRICIFWLSVGFL